MDEDYREILAQTAEEAYIEQMDLEYEEEKAKSWSCIFRDDQIHVYMNYNGEVRVIGKPYIERMFENE